MFGKRGNRDFGFEPDAAHFGNRTVLQIETGSALMNYQFFKDSFQAFVMQPLPHGAIAVGGVCNGSKHFGKVVKFLDTSHASNRLKLPFDGVLIIEY